MSRLAQALALVLLPCLLAACGSNGGSLPSAGPAPAAQGPASEYRIQVGDALAIKFFLNPELNEEVVVRPDGRISLQLIPEVVAAGRTPAEVADRLKQLYGAEMRDPEIAVIVRSFSAQRVYVDGEVEKPGEVPLVGPLTLLQAVASAGGFTDRAHVEEVILIRRRSDRTPAVMPLNVELARSGEDLSQDPALLPFDIVYVPRSAVANVNIWIDQYIRKNIPVSFGFRYDPFN